RGRQLVCLLLVCRGAHPAARANRQRDGHSCGPEGLSGGGRGRSGREPSALSEGGAATPESSAAALAAEETQPTLVGGRAAARQAAPAGASAAARPPPPDGTGGGAPV